MNSITLLNILFLIIGCFGLQGDERLNSLSFITSVNKRTTVDNFDDAESLAQVTQALVDCTSAGEVNITASSLWNETLGTIVQNNTDRSLVKRDWTTTQWIGLGFVALGQTAATIGGVMPYCRSNHRPEWSNTWQCVTLGIGVLLGFDGAYLLGQGGDSAGVERIASVGLKSESDKRDITSNITMHGRQNWLDIVEHAKAKGFTPMHLMYDRADLYSDGSVIVTNPIVTYDLDNSPIINYINNGDGFMYSIDDFSHINKDNHVDK